MMRMKWWIGLSSVAIIGIAAGSYLCTPSAAQDAPPTGKPRFDPLKKEVDANKDVALPALPMSSNGLAPVISSPVVVDVPKPSPSVVVPPSPSPAAGASAGAQVAPPAQAPQVEDQKPFDVVPPLQSSKPTPNAKPPVTGSAPAFPSLPQAAKPSTAEPATIQSEPVPPPSTSVPSNSTPPVVGTTEPVKPGVPTYPPTPPPAAPELQRPRDPVFPPPTVEVPTPLIPPVSPPQPNLVIPMPKNSPWSFQVDVAGSQTTVTATVNKKHVFKIVCKHVDLQTERGTLKAKGTVQISGDAMEGTCAFLSIPLGDDRLVLEGAAEVRIRKSPTSGYVSDAKVAQFELKGDTLNLRISDLLSSKYVQTSLTQAGEPGPGKLASPTNSPSSGWTPNGRLRQTRETHGEQVVWCLENGDGQVMCRFATREGGFLSEYVGRTISVHLEPLDKTMSRVTHIAVP